jgi:hypothetical protein
MVWVPKATLAIANDTVTAGLVGDSTTATYSAVGTVVAPIVESALAADPTIAAGAITAATAAVNSQIAAKDLVASSDARLNKIATLGGWIRRTITPGGKQLDGYTDQAIFIRSAPEQRGTVTTRATRLGYYHWLLRSPAGKILFGVKRSGQVTAQLDAGSIAYIVSKMGGALETNVINPALEMMNLYLYGHSWVQGTGSQTPGARFYDRIARRFGLQFLSNILAANSAGAWHPNNKGVAGHTSGDLANLTIQYPVVDSTSTVQGYGWQPYASKGLVLMCNTINDLTLFQGSAAALVGYKHAWRASLATITAMGLKASKTTQFAFDLTANWTKETVAATSASTAGATAGSTGGVRWKTTTVGAYFLTTVQGTSADLFFVARTTGGGVYTITVDGTAFGTFDLSAATAQDTPAVYKMRGMSNAAHTIQVTFTSGTSMTIDSYRIPHPEPVPIVVFREGTVIPKTTSGSADYANYVSDLTTVYGPALAAVCAEYPSVIYIDLDAAGWNPSLHLGADNTYVTPTDGQKHPSDRGSAFMADAATTALRSFAWSNGVNILAGSAVTAAYTPPTIPTVPGGGFAGNA